MSETPSVTDEEVKTPEGQESDTPKDEEVKEDVAAGETGDAASTDTPASDVDESPELEVVREGSQPKKDNKRKDWVPLKRLKQTVDQRNEAVSERDQMASEKEVLVEKNKLLELKLSQKEGKSTKLVEPDPANYDEEEGSTEYLRDKKDYDTATFNKKVAEEVRKHLDVADKSNQQRLQTEATDRNLTVYYKNVTEHGDPNYDDAEKNFIEAVGEEDLRYLAGKFPEDTHILVSYLGHKNNAAELRELAETINRDPVLGLDKISSLRRELKVQKKSKKTLPNPDEPISGASPASTDDEVKRQKILQESSEKDDPNIYLDYMDRQRKEKARAGTG